MKGEPRITINGTVLTDAQAMTIRVALNSYAIDLRNEDALGSDETGRALRNGYCARLREINGLIFAK